MSTQLAIISGPGAVQSGVRSRGAFVLSIGFWACVAAAAVLFGSVALAARIVENSQLQRDTARRQSALLTLSGDVEHLQRVVTALQSDAELVGTISRHELPDHLDETSAIRLHGRLRHDPRTVPPEPVDVAWEAAWYLPILESLATSPQRRLRWSLTAAALLVFGFVFLHENAGSRLVGRTIAAPLRWLGNRYRRPAAE